jgi:hypothetical protein
MSGDGRVSYDFAVLRVVPHVHLGDFTPVGVILHARTAEFLGMRALTDPALLRERFPGLDHDLLVRYLKTFEGICRGDAAAGPMALEPPGEGLHKRNTPRAPHQTNTSTG